MIPLRKRHELERRAHCATWASSWMQGRLSFFSVALCVISECRLSLKNAVVISKESERISISGTLKIQLVHFYWCIFTPVLSVLRTSKPLFITTLCMESWSPNSVKLTWCWGEGWQLEGEGKAGEEHRILHFPGDHWKRPERKSKG